MFNLGTIWANNTFISLLCEARFHAASGGKVSMRANWTQAAALARGETEVTAPEGA